MSAAIAQSATEGSSAHPVNPTTMTTAPAATSHHEYRTPYPSSGNPSDTTIGQNDGLGRWIECPPPPGCSSPEAPAGTRTRRPVSSSAYLRCQNSSSECTVGISSKL